MVEHNSHLSMLLQKHESVLLNQWSETQRRLIGSKVSTQELKTQCQDFLRLMVEATHVDKEDSIDGPAWNTPKKMLAEVSRARTLQGFSPTQTATFVFSLKRPLFDLLRKELTEKPNEFANAVWSVTQILDQLGLYTAEIHQRSREEVINRQQEDMLELSTPVVKLWDGILALPMIGTLDSNRTQIVMESLLQKIMETESEIAIIDITGVPTVDTLVAQHLIKTVTAARLMGAECIISGIRPQIAATIVHLGVELGGIATKSTLADAFKLALSRTGRSVGKKSPYPISAARELRQ
ncbi:MAG: STAS domain-containing protein [Bdellovibrionales bacterium]|nr:STAS domain-containing protein [Bdellovibrionales bacterium]